MHKRKIFVGSSVEGLPVAEAFAEHFEHDKEWEAVVWPDAGFELGRTTLDSLGVFLDDYEYGVFVMTPDDDVRKRDSKAKQPRDNVLFELGLFLGRPNGLRKTFMISPTNTKIELPTDLSGINRASFSLPLSDDRKELRTKLASTARAVKTQLQKFEKKNREDAAISVRETIIGVKQKLRSESDERKKIQIVTESLQSVLADRAAASLQSVNDTLKDVLLWVGSLLDFIDVEQLSENQTSIYNDIWVYAPVPLELSSANSELKNQVAENLSKDVKYKYFVDGVGGVSRIKSLIESMESDTGNSKLRANVSIAVFSEFDFLTYYTFEFMDRNNFIVLQSVIREDRDDISTKLPPDHARKVVELVRARLKGCVTKEEDGFKIQYLVKA